MSVLVKVSGLFFAVLVFLALAPTHINGTQLSYLATNYNDPNNTLTEVLIGVMLPFSYPSTLWQTIFNSSLATFYMAATNAYAQNLMPGTKIRLLVQDTWKSTSPNLPDGTTSQSIIVAMNMISQGVVAIIGDGTSGETAQSGVITSRFSIPQCSFSAASDVLSDKSQYPYFFRTLEPSQILGKYMIGYMLHMGWKNVALIYTNEAVGQAYFTTVVNNCLSHGITILVKTPITGSASTFPEPTITSALSLVAQSQARIIVTVGVSTAGAYSVIQGYFAGLVSKDYVWISFNSLNADAYNNAAKAIKWRANMSDPLLANLLNVPVAQLSSVNASDRSVQTTFVETILRGTVNVGSTGGEVPGASFFQPFLDQWNSLNTTLWPHAGQYVPNIRSSYTCLWALINGFNSFYGTLSNNNTVVTQAILNGSLGSKLLPSRWNTSVDSPMGPLQFDANGDVLDHFNVQYYGEGVMNTCGYLDGNLVFTPEPGVPCRFNDNGTVTPSDLPPITTWNLLPSTLLGNIFIALHSVGVMYAVCLLILVFVNMRKLRALSPLFCALIIIGLLIGHAAVLTYIGIPSNLMCVLRPFLLATSFAMVFANVFVKALRLYMIFENPMIGLRNAMSDKMIAIFAACVVAIEILMIGLWTALDSPLAVTTSLTPTTTITLCTYARTDIQLVFSIVLFAFNALIMIVTAILAIKTKATGQFSEARYTGFTAFVLLLISVIGIPLVFMSNFIGPSIMMQEIILLISLFSTSIITFLPVLIAIKQKASAASKNSRNSGGFGGKEDGTMDQPDDLKRLRLGNVGQEAGKVIQTLMLTLPVQKKKSRTSLDVFTKWKTMQMFHSSGTKWFTLVTPDEKEEMFVSLVNAIVEPENETMVIWLECAGGNVFALQMANEKQMSQVLTRLQTTVKGTESTNATASHTESVKTAPRAKA